MVVVNDVMKVLNVEELILGELKGMPAGEVMSDLLEVDKEMGNGVEERGFLRIDGVVVGKSVFIDEIVVVG